LTTFPTNVLVDERPIDLQLWDTAGQLDYDSMRPISYPNTDVLIVCFSIVDPVSLQNVLHKWHEEVMHHCPKVPKILIGTKVDLRTDEKAINELKQRNQQPLTTQQGKELASKLKYCQYVECSALTQKNLKEVFDEACRVVLFPERYAGKKSMEDSKNTKSVSKKDKKDCVVS